MSLIKSLLNSMLKPFSQVKEFVVELLDIHEVDVNEIAIDILKAKINEYINTRSLTLDQLRAIEVVVCSFNFTDEIDEMLFAYVGNVAQTVSCFMNHKGVDDE